MAAMDSMESSIASMMSFSSGPSRRVFPFFELPAEIRLRIYEFVLIQPDETIDLDPLNYRTIRPRLSCFLVCRRMHDEAYHVFYGAPQQPLRLFPTHGRFFHTKKPLLTRIGPKYRRAVHTLELRLGPGWSKPPRCWHVREEQGLADCKSLRKLKIIIQVDPSGDIFNGFRGHGNDKDTYKIFCVNILEGIFAQVPSLEVVELDGYPGLTTDTPLVRGLTTSIRSAGKRVAYGPMRGWGTESDQGKMIIGLENALAAMSISLATAESSRQAVTSCAA